jgi:hypothetical protein
MEQAHGKQGSGTTASRGATAKRDKNGHSKRGSESRSSGIAEMGSEAASQIGDAAQAAGRQAKHAASSIASQANEEVRRLADRQVSVGADFVGQVAESVRSAAGSFDQNVPQLADLARGAAERLEDLSETIRDRSAAELLYATADFARRRPALVFGATALGGFLLFRLLSTGAEQDFAGASDEFEDDWESWQGDDEMSSFESGDSARMGGSGGLSGGKSYGV